MVPEVKVALQLHNEQSVRVLYFGFVHHFKQVDLGSLLNICLEMSR